LSEIEGSAIIHIVESELLGFAVFGAFSLLNHRSLGDGQALFIELKWGARLRMIVEEVSEKVEVGRLHRFEGYRKGEHGGVKIFTWVRFKVTVGERRDRATRAEREDYSSSREWM
jgi:hypothetical protein